MKKVFETPRLILREFNEGDANFLLELLNSKGWLENIGDRGVKTLEQAEVYLKKNYIDEYPKYGFGFYLMEKKETGESIGMCGFIKRPVLEDVDIGFALLTQFEKKGYAFEAASATMNFGNEVLGFQKITAITTSENLPSQNLLKKIGLRFEKMIDFKGEELMLFSN